MARLLLKDLTPGTAYKVQLRSKDRNSVSEWSRLFNLSTTTDTTPPDVPAWAVSNDWVSSGDTFIATWQPLDFNLEQNQDFSHYEVRITDGVVSRTVYTNNTSYTLTYDQNRIYFGTAKASLQAQVRSVDLVGNTSAYNDIKSASNPAPSAPGSIGVTPLYDSVKVDWATVADLDLAGYRLFVSTTSSSTGFTQVYEGPNTSFVHNTVNFTTDHWYRIYAFDKFGTLSAAVTSSAVRPKSTLTIDTTPPAAPTAFHVTSSIDPVSQNQVIDATWTASASADVSTYEIRYGRSNIGPWQYMSVSHDATAARLEGLDQGYGYYVDIRAVDFAGNSSSWVHESANYPLSPAFDTTPPNQPSVPTASVGVQRIQVVHDGKDSSNIALANDTDYIRVYASTTSGFTPSNANMLGIIKRSPAMVETFQIPASSTTPAATTETWYVKVIAVDFAGNASTASNQATAAVGLILTANIGDAQITTAKIQSLEANKIVAGTGFINNLTVKSTFTLGDATNNGVIQSYDYDTSSGATGFSLAKTGLIIKTGQIEAAALKIQSGPNVMTPMFADFTSQPTAYKMLKASGYDVTIESGAGVFEDGYLKINATSNGMPGVDLQNPNDRGHTFLAEQNVTYIISFYSWLDAPGAMDINFWGYTYDSADDQVDTEGIGGVEVNTTTPFRYSFEWSPTAPDTRAVGLNVGLDVPGIVNFDGFQVERKIGSLSTPSPWSRPGNTRINGGQISVGEIRSNTEFTIPAANSADDVTLPTWSINMDGNAQFANLYVRGNAIVGFSADEDTGADTQAQAGSRIQSFNYSPTMPDDPSSGAGWAIHSNGLSEFRNVVVGSFPGDAVSPGTLSAGAIKAGSVLANEVIVEGQFHAVGDMGEDIGLSGDGFRVLGPYQVSISSIQVSSSVATITTATTHGFAAGNKLVVTGLGDPYDGTYVISSVTTNTVTFAITAPNVGTTTVIGVAKSLSTNLSVTRPTLIEFPTDGANPNIISGQLKADNLIVLKSGSLMGPITLENTTFTIASGVIPPRSAPTVSTYYDQQALTGGPTLSGIYGYTRDGSGNYYTYGKNATYGYVVKYNSSGAYDSTKMVQTLNINSPSVYIPGTGQWTRPFTETYYPRGLTYSSTYNRFYITYSYIYYAAAWKNPSTGVTSPVNTYKEERVESYDTSWAFTGTVTPLSDAGNDAGWRGTTLGWDFVGNRPIHILSINGGSPTLRYLNLDGSGNVTSFTSPVTLNQLVGMVDPRFITKVNATHVPEFGGERFVIKEVSGGGATGTYANNLNRWTTINTSTNNPVTNEAWPTAFNATVWAGYFDVGTQRFYGLNTSTIYKYEAQDSYWTTDANMSKTRPIAYAWYDSQPLAPGGGPGGTYSITTKSLTSNVARLTTSVAHGMSSTTDVGRWVEVTGVGTPFDGWAQITSIPTTTTFEYAKTNANISSTSATGTMKYRVHETNLSPSFNLAFQKRSKIKVDITAIPYFAGEYPDMARVYMAESVGGTYYRRLVISYPSTTDIILPSTALSGAQPMPGTNNGFSIVNNPSKIVTTDGQSWWDGTGEARFLDVNYVGDDWVNVTFQNSWTDYGSPYQTVQYRREGRKVILRGLAKSGTMGLPMFTLPTDCRPVNNHLYDGVMNLSTRTSGAASTGTAHTHSTTVADASFRLNIGSDGTVVAAIPAGSTQANGYVSLSGIEIWLD